MKNTRLTVQASLQKLVEQMLKKRYIEYTENKDKRGRNGTV